MTSLAFFLLPSFLLAQAYHCNGVWTMEPCEGEEVRTLPPIGRHEAPKFGGDKSETIPTISLPKLAKTRIRVDGEPRWMISNYSKGLSLTGAEVLVRNAGSNIAQGVRVTAMVGQQVYSILSGPESIEPGKSALFTLGRIKNRTIQPGLELQVRLNCLNCRK
ncbi:MAG: hypothetical protein KDD62_15010 [Bdellovibrionales bacterium]|nr:hypothetical protein [Bdellovibrionales bacterium]